jgi:hypothetical protein
VGGSVGGIAAVGVGQPVLVGNAVTGGACESIRLVWTG